MQSIKDQEIVVHQQLWVLILWAILMSFKDIQSRLNQLK